MLLHERQTRARSTISENANNAVGLDRLPAPWVTTAKSQQIVGLPLSTSATLSTEDSMATKFHPAIIAVHSGCASAPRTRSADEWREARDMMNATHGVNCITTIVVMPCQHCQHATPF